jgi:hypothetical protein
MRRGEAGSTAEKTDPTGDCQENPGPKIESLIPSVRKPVITINRRVSSGRIVLLGPASLLFAHRLPSMNAKEHSMANPRRSSKRETRPDRVPAKWGRN